MPKADETGRHPRDHGRSLGAFAVHRCVRAGDTQSPRGRDAQTVHGLAAQELADARSATRAPAVAHARVRGQASALELHFESVWRFAPVRWHDRRPAVPAQTPKLGGRCRRWPAAGCQRYDGCRSGPAAAHQTTAGQLTGQAPVPQRCFGRPSRAAGSGVGASGVKKLLPRAAKLLCHLRPGRGRPFRTCVVHGWIVR